MSFAYIGSPYTSHDPEVMEYRYQSVMEVTADLLAKGIPVYSPIVHCHVMANKFALPKNFDFWQKYNEAMLSGADLLYVIKIYNWERSKGLAWEIEYARKNNIPVVYLEFPLGKTING